jgi:hypothetical protein
MVNATIPSSGGDEGWVASLLFYSAPTPTPCMAMYRGSVVKLRLMRCLHETQILHKVWLDDTNFVVRLGRASIFVGLGKQKSVGRQIFGQN